MWGSTNHGVGAALTAVLASGALSAQAGPISFDGEPRVVRPSRPDSTATSQLGGPVRVSGNGVIVGSRTATASLRLSLNGFPPIALPGAPFLLNAAFDTPGSVPRSFILPASVVNGGVFPGPGSGVTGISVSVVNAAATVAASGVGSGALAGHLDFCLFGSGSCQGAMGRIPVPLSVIGRHLASIITKTNGFTVTVMGQRWTSGFAVTTGFGPTPSGSGYLSAFGTGSRGPNSISLVSPFLIRTNVTGFLATIPAIARLNVNFVPLATTTSTTLATTTTTTPCIPDFTAGCEMVAPCCTGTCDADFCLPLPSTTTTTLPGGTVDVGVTGKKLIIVDKLDSGAGKAKVAYVAKDTAVAKGATNDPTQISATFSYQVTTLGTSGSTVMPQGGDWVVNKETVAKYVNKDAPAGGAVKVAVIKPGKLLKAVLKDLGDSGSVIDIYQGGATTSPVDAATQYTVMDGGTTVRHCGEFTDCTRKIIAGGSGAKVVCKTAVPGASVSCP